MVRIRWTEEALFWLREIRSYIAEDNPAAAQRVVRGIYDKIQTLEDFPRMGFRYTDRPEQEIRVLLYGHYRIVYQVLVDDVVEILGIYHGALDIERYLSR